MRLQKFLRDQNIGSLRKCDELIQNKEIFVNDVCLVEPTCYLKDNDIVTYKKKNYIYKEEIVIKHYYYLFNKPINVLCSHSDKYKRKLIFDFFRKEKILKNRKLFYAGRLDYNSRGLIILSTDGNFIQSMIHPSYDKLKYYLVRSKYPVNEKELKKLSMGDDLYFPFKFEIIEKNYVKLILSQGKNRQIRNIYSMMNNHVDDLFRYKIDIYDVEDIKEGCYTPIPYE